ncbi:LOW QUALITY PROTEIN: hypothetical protein Cgig2_018568 [Carnegiea gigantea]|uniref:Uncharacterized protein n=1 Tax=Carnegiea gigantea TaxID=171969 RepID=A0A9Q1KLT3_9CARY|nr:LOW QUALITY PROTEIN: hypothetical protein Cgig2_018568 [Carnegiea gigantea]
MTLLLRSPDLSIQGVGCLVPYALTIAGRRDKLHLLGVTAFILGPLTLVHIVELGLKIAVLLKRLGQRRQDLAYQHVPAGSLVSWPGPPFTPPRLHQPRPSQVPPLAGAASPSFRLPGRPDQPLGFPNVAGTDLSNLQHSAAALTPGAIASAMATSFSVTFGGSEVPGMAKS